mgnify:CR=1 FL=1
MPPTPFSPHSPSFEAERMTHETPKWQTLWLLVGFGLLIGIGVVTVLLPELRDEQEPEAETELAAPAEALRQE